MNKINHVNKNNCIGQTISNNKKSTATIIEYKSGKYKSGKCVYPPKIKVKFNDDFGYSNWYRKNKIEYGSFRNPYEQSFFGIGMLGIKYDSNHFLFRRWIGMIGRCYDSNHKSYDYYGRDGVRVCVEWLIFENYVDDVINIGGYNYNMVTDGELELDKDTIGKKLYSKDTCVWIPASENRAFYFE